jgi:hypothetical protein
MTAHLILGSTHFLMTEDTSVAALGFWKMWLTRRVNSPQRRETDIMVLICKEEFKIYLAVFFERSHSVRVHTHMQMYVCTGTLAGV